MHKRAKSAIHDLVLNLRETLEGEVERELRRYGIYPERDWLPADKLDHLTDEERSQHRPRIEAAIARERDAGLSQAEAVEAYVREAAYTHMNRLLGLKCMEMRGLIEETVTTHSIYSERSKRHRDYLDEHPRAHRAPDRGLIPMLNEAYAEVSQHIGVVFAPDSDHTVIWPRHTVLKGCIDQINALDEKVARKLGKDPDAMPSVYADDTFLGWVYQYFQEEEKDRVFRELRTKKKKIGGYDIVPATTIYTEHYMVQFLVENSLGALWMEMYPDSNLCQRWDYFVEDPNLQNEDGTRQRGRDPRPVAELPLLDPACGSGHFLLYAFDLFAQMYEAEARMEGRPVDRLAIARRILRENLHGIDIDLRSIQLSALNLYMKACTYADLRLEQLQNGEPVQMNLACADIVLREGSELEELLARFENDPLTQELIKTIWQGLQNARELGSLLKVEEQIDEVIARKREAEKGTFWEHPEDLWEQWKRDFLDTLKSYVDRAAEAFDVNRRMFGQEAIRGLQFLSLLARQYDVVTTNPPFMGDRNMGDTLKRGVKALHPRTASDLYAASVNRFSALTCSTGFLSMIVQQTLLFTKDFEDLRRLLLEEFGIRTVAHLGPGAFEDISGEKVAVALFTVVNGEVVERICSFFQLVDAVDKEETLKSLCHSPTEGSYFEASQSNFRDIQGHPFLYWAGERALRLFTTASPLSEFADVKTGLSTGNDSRFLRKVWEVSKSEILMPDDEFRNAKWFLHPKGGGYCRYYGNLDNVILWKDNGAELESSGASIRNESYYYQEGLTYTLVSSTRFSVRAMPRNCVFNFGGSAIFPTRLPRVYLLGLLNTTLVNSLLNMLNPTTNYPVGDVSKIPVVSPSEQQLQSVSELTRICVKAKRWFLQFDVTDLEFVVSGLEEGHRIQPAAETITACYEAFLRVKEVTEARLALAEGLIEKAISSLYEIDLRAMIGIVSDLPIPSAWQSLRASHMPLASDLFPRIGHHIQELCSVHSQPPERPEFDENLRQLYTSGILRSVEEMSTELAINPVSFVFLRREMSLINPDDLKHEVENFLTHRIWELCKQDEDGIIPYAEGLRNPPLLDQVRGEIEDIFGAENAVSIEVEMDEILGRGGLPHWLENPFFKKHKSQFKRRPILWHITSRDKHFRVLVYYHKLDRDTLPKVRGQYLWPQLERARAKLRAAKMEDPPEVKTIGEMEEIIADLEDCDERLERVIRGDVDVNLPGWAVGPYRDGQPPYDPDLDDGVKVNILPLQAAGLLPYKRVV